MKFTFKKMILWTLIGCLFVSLISCNGKDSPIVDTDVGTLDEQTVTTEAGGEVPPPQSGLQIGDSNTEDGWKDVDSMQGVTEKPNGGEEEEIKVEIKEELKAKYEGQTIDLYLIAGQSNGAGFSKLTTEFTNSDPAFTQGYSNVLYSGNSVSTYENNTIAYYPREITLQKTVVGLGKNNTYFGPELGIAEALSTYYNAESGKMAGIVKFAAGGTNLSDVTTGRYAAAGNWTSPSYLAENGANGSMSGGLYRKFIEQVKISVAEYEAHGYTVQIKGVFWMQGESDSKQSGITSKYPKLFEYLVNDMRKDLGAIVETDLSALPIVVGEISDAYNIKHLQTSTDFVKMQNNMIKNMPNVYIVHSSVFGVGTDATDESHWTPDDIYFIGQMVGNKFLNVCGIAQTTELTVSTPVAALYDQNGSLIGSYASLAYAINSAPNGATVKLLSDIKLYGNLNINNRNSVIVDGNGFQIDSYSITHGVRLVGCDVTFRNFVFYHHNSAEAAYGIYIYEGAKMTYDSGSLSASCYGIVINQDCTLTINGGSFFTRKNPNKSCGVLYVSYGGTPAPTRNNTSIITINGGIFTAAANCSAIYIKKNSKTLATVTVNGGTMVVSNGVTAIVNGGTYATLEVDETKVTYRYE